MPISSTAAEVNPVTGLVKVRFDDGREAWVLLQLDETLMRLGERHGVQRGRGRREGRLPDHQVGPRSEADLDL